MKNGTQLDWWTDGRTPIVSDTLVNWSAAASTSDGGDTAEQVRDYLSELLLDDIEIVELPTSRAVYASRNRAGADAPTVLILGVHDLPVQSGGDPGTDPGARSDAEGVLGPGVASRFGSFVAHVEGFMGLSNELEGRLEVNAKFLAVAESALQTGDLDALVDRLPLGDVDTVVATAATAWDLNAPTITVGSRGELVVEIEVNAGRDLALMTFGGASRNPLTVLTEALGRLREPNGRISLPGFYHRATPASDEERSALSRDGYDPAAWLSATGALRLDGGPSPLERVSLWPSLDVLSIEAGAGRRAAGRTIPGSARAVVAFQLVPDQRPSEIEAALRSWLEQRVPPEVGLAVRVISSTDPHQVDRSSEAILAQARALKRVVGNAPIPVASGGMAGLSGIADRIGASMIYSGVAAPASHTQTAHERLSVQRFRLGVNLAGELFDQLQPRQSGFRARFDLSS